MVSVACAAEEACSVVAGTVADVQWACTKEKASGVAARLAGLLLGLGTLDSARRTARLGAVACPGVGPRGQGAVLALAGRRRQHRPCRRGEAGRLVRRG